MKLFATEDDAIKWVGMNIPYAIKPKRKAKYLMINPFSSTYAFRLVVESLGKQLFKHQQEKIKQ